MLLHGNLSGAVCLALKQIWLKRPPTLASVPPASGGAAKSLTAIHSRAGDPLC
jgi:hypothetical protein